jgi:hypothetical protein
MKLSVSTWSVLDLLRLRFGVEIFMFDASLEPVVEPGIAPGAALALMDEPGMRDRCRAVLATDDSRSPRTANRAVRALPFLLGREPHGVLVVTSPERHARDVRDDEIVTLDAAAQIGIAVIEQDLAQNRDLTRERESSRRYEGVLRFLRVLTQAGATETEVMRGVVQAATLWFDLDCRIYVRTTADAFSLFAALPGYSPRDLPIRLSVERVREFARQTRVDAPSDLEELGWHVARGSALVLLFGGDPEWALVAGDVITPEVELTFEAVTHVLGCALVRRAAERDAQWRERLSALPPQGLERALRDLLRQLSNDLDGLSVRLSLADGGETKTVAFAGDAAAAAGTATHDVQFGRRLMALEVGHAVGGPTFEQVATVRAWVRAVELWLLGASVGEPVSESEAEMFERRIQDEVERAKRSNAGLGVVLVRTERAATAAAQEPLLSALRSASRASDLTGRVRDGMLAIVLIHAKSEGADSVVSRLRRRLKSAGGPAGIRIGHAMFSPEIASADALIRAALGEMDAA